MQALDGTEPPYAAVPGGKLSNANQTFLDESGFNFMTSCVAALEGRGLEDQGMYRVVGVASKVTKLMTMGLDRRRCDNLNLEDNIEWETKTVTSAIKTFLRNLPGKPAQIKCRTRSEVQIFSISEPLLTFSLYSQFIEAGKTENYSVRLGKVEIMRTEAACDELCCRCTDWCSSCPTPTPGCWRCSSATSPTSWSSATRTS